MPLVKFGPPTVGKPCPHNYVHGVHRTKDGREWGMCQLTDDHLKRLEAVLRRNLNDAYRLPFILQAAKGDYEPDIVEMEDKLRLTVAERKRRKDVARLATNSQA